jgi:hypothetical protein
MSVVKVSSLAFAAWMVSAGAFAADGEWTVRKSSGEVWTGGQGVQPVSLGQSNGQETVLKPGDTVTTGRNGRVLLVRGQETILIAPNSVVGIPAEKKDGLATTITQQAGSILLEVEKRNVPHFEVETPYLAAVVKGTQFRVSVTATGTRVDVQRGQVEVVDFKSGQIAQVLPGQAAQSFAHGAQGLALTGTGAFKPIEHGVPRAPTLELIKVPKSGIRTPPTLERGRPSTRTAQGAQHQDARSAHHSAVRISAPLGEVRLNVQKVTHGLARSTSAAGDTGRRASGQATTIWSAPDGQSGTAAAASSVNASNGSSNSNGNGGGNGAGASTAASASGGSAATAAVAAGSSGNGNANGNGNSGGNGNGSGNSNGGGSGNGKGNNGNGGNSNGGNGNGNGNGNAGNGNGHGKSKS